MITLLLVAIIFHRVGMVIAFVSSAIVPWFPFIFPLEADQKFAKQVYAVLYRVSLTGISILLITGPIRLAYGIPHLFAIKAIAVLVTLYLFIFVRNEYNSDNFQRVAIYRFCAILVTATIGLLLRLF